MKVLKFTVPGEPKGKGRPRMTRQGHAYTPKETAMYENLIAVSFHSSFPAWEPTTEPLSVIFDAYFSIPKSWSKRKQEQARLGTIRPTTKPDTDNIAKCKDALNGIAWADDKQVVHEEVSKFYSDTPRLEITIERWESE